MRKLELMMKSTLVVIGAILVAGLMSINVLAAGGTVNASNVNVRSSADTTSNSVAVVNTNDAVTINTEVTGTDGKTWYNVTTAGGVTGFIRADLVTKTQDAAATTTTTTTTTTPATTDNNAAGATTNATTTTNNTTTTTTTTPATTEPKVQVTAINNQTAYIAPASVNIRKTPSTNGDIVAKAQQNSVITLTGETQASDNYKWYQVSFEANGTTMTGFIRSDLITFTAPTVKPEQTEITGQQGGQEEPEETPVEEPVAEEPVEEPVVEEPVEEPAPSTSTGISSLHAIQPGAAPSVIPTGFEEVEVKFGNDTVSAYAKGDYYLIYAENGDNNPMWYIFDYRTSNFIQYDGLLSSADVKGGGLLGGTTNIIILAVAAVIILVLAIVVVLLLLRRGRGGNDDDYETYDSYDDDDKYTKPSTSAKKTIYAKDSVEDILDDDDLYDDDIVPSTYAPEPKQTYVEEETYSDSYSDDEYEDDEEEEEYIEKPKKVKKEKVKKEKVKKEKPAKKGKKSLGAKFLDYFTEVEEVEDDEDEEDDDYEEEEYVKPAKKSSAKSSYIPDDDEDDINFIDL